MLSVLVTETAINEVGKHNLFNNIFYKLNKYKINFKILTFKSKETKKDYSYRTLKPEVMITKVSSFKLINNFYLFFSLIKLNPDHLIIGGYGYPQAWTALFYSLIYRKKKTLWTGASKITSLSKNHYLNFLKSIFVKNFDNSIVYGSNAKKYLLQLGFKKKIFLTYNISDIEYFSSYKLNLRRNKKNKVPRFVYCARLVNHKGIKYLLETFKKFKKDKYILSIVGDGPLRDYVISANRSNKLNINYLGKVSQKELLKVFKNSDYFVSTTFNDPFSRTLSEAISAGCFCISSKFDDASHDLINYRNGIVYNPRLKGSLYNIISKIMINSALFCAHASSHKSIKFNTEKYSLIYCNSILDALNV